MKNKLRWTPAIFLLLTACSTKEEAATKTSDVSLAQAPSATAIPIKVYKTPTCGCCKAWVQHLEENGFKVEVMDMPDLSSVKAKYGVKPDMQACHTAVVGNYVVE